MSVLPHLSDESPFVTFEFGVVKTWWYKCTFVAFQLMDGRLYTCEFHPLDDLDSKHYNKIVKKVPGARFVDPLPEKQFTAAWGEATDQYLYPEVVGKLTVAWPGFGPDVPLGILADYLEDHDCVAAAKALREKEKQNGIG